MTEDVLTMCHALDLAAYCAVEAKKQIDGTHGGKSIDRACKGVEITSEPHQTGTLIVTTIINLDENTASVSATHEPRRND